MDRRTFVKAGCIGSASLLIQGLDPMMRADVAPIAVPPIELRGLPGYKPSPLGMPGLFPGRVVEIRDPKAIVRNRISQPIVHRMLERAMQDLTGEKSAQAAWAKFVEPNDVVGIKINPSGAPACCSSPEIVREIIAAVQSIGVPARNILIYDRYSYEMDIGSYQALLPPGVRIIGIQDAFVDSSGYDPNIFCCGQLFRRVGNPLLHGKYRLAGSHQDYQRAHNEGPFGLRYHWSSQESGLRHIQQCGALTSRSSFLYQPTDRSDVYG